MTKFSNSPALAVIALVLFAVICILVLRAAFASTMARVDWVEEEYRVKSGDTLWSISGEYCPDNVDRREWIAEVQELNGLDSSVIYRGQRLTVLVPVEVG